MIMIPSEFLMLQYLQIRYWLRYLIFRICEDQRELILWEALRGLGELKKRVDSGEMKVAFALYPGLNEAAYNYS